ncbi:hypothetical protein CASFOL_001743 [Castilleja foliolosa]|uniref:NADH dehydrogenase [ubiquinone] 1 alpha subcomplex subunit 8 n=1 Tax=Castilleja foliolosa TaxID=1961234 RepID=A0ABD3ECN9_9LAMI
MCINCDSLPWVYYSRMANAVDTAGEPVPASSVLMAAAKHIGSRCRGENVAFLKCKKDDPNPEKCLEKGRQVTQCVFHLAERYPTELQKNWTLMPVEFEFCRKEQKEFEKACSL